MTDVFRDPFMNVKLVRIGNSRGVRIPKPLIEEACLTENVALRIVNAGILIERITAPRTGWAEAAQEVAAESRDEPVADHGPVASDSADWTWE